MVITYYGVSCFKMVSAGTVLAFDPFSKEFPAKDYGLKLPRFQADIVLISHNYHKDHNGYDTLSGPSLRPLAGQAGRQQAGGPFIIDGPGEYEVGGIYINGISSFHDNEQGKDIGLNTIYTVQIEGMNICHMGDFGEAKLRDEIKEAIGEVDILFIPIVAGIAGKPVGIPQKAAKIATEISPKIIIPMHYHKEKKALRKFIDDMGGDGKPVEKLTVKKKDLESKETEVIVLNAQ
jgi:L-ascorbate metabolism protein UlaG (beta-lactamase superfamily)